MFTKFNYPHFSLLVLSYLLADWLTAAGTIAAGKYNLVDKPHTYKTHITPTPFIGGVGIFLGFAITIFSILRFETNHFHQWMNIFSIVTAGGFILILGLIDDFRPINATIKLSILLLTTYILFSYNIRLSLFPPDFLWNLPNFLLSLLWLAGVISALNSLDNMDGAAAGITAIASLCIFVMAWYTYQRWLSYVSISLAGASIGFLRYNFHYQGAKIFLGDNGSFFLGFTLATMAVLGSWSGLTYPGAVRDYDSLKSIIIPCIILTVPLYDITLSTVLRLLNGQIHSTRQAIEYCGKDHLAHRLVALGCTRRQAVMLLYFMAAGAGTIACIIVIFDLPLTAYLSISAGGIFILVILGYFLNKAKVYQKETPGQKATRHFRRHQIKKL
ncbi:MraY family glycosyltransferase [Planctomycetota bacterium]